MRKLKTINLNNYMEVNILKQCNQLHHLVKMNLDNLFRMNSIKKYLKIKDF